MCHLYLAHKFTALKAFLHLSMHKEPCPTLMIERHMHVLHENLIRLPEFHLLSSRLPASSTLKHFIRPLPLILQNDFRILWETTISLINFRLYCQILSFVKFAKLCSLYLIYGKFSIRELRLMAPSFQNIVFGWLWGRWLEWIGRRVYGYCGICA